MVTIYKLTNVINGKIYIGQTKFSLEKRFGEHCRDSRRDKLKHRPLYTDMQKYGIENFTIEPIEKVLENISDEREIYWIDFYKSHIDGYNISLGGKGKKFVSEDMEKLIVSTYEDLKNIKAVAKKLSLDQNTVSKICKKYNIQILSSQEINRIKLSKSINMFDKQHCFIRKFTSAGDAIRYIKNISDKLRADATHIIACANGKRKTAYGYVWEWAS